MNMTESRRTLLADALDHAATASRDAWPAVLCAASVFLLTHPFAGIIADSQIYMGRALADGDPGGVGRDMMFVLDGQSQFSLFIPLARSALAVLSPALGAQLIVVMSQALLIAALLLFSRHLAGRRFVWIAIIAAVLPAGYGPPGVLHFAEPLAEPRPLAEAFVLFGLAAWLADRRLASIGLLAVAAAIHPLMACAGFATVGIILMTEHVAWRFIAGAAACAFVAAAALGLPFAGRLLETADPQWLELLRTRSPLLFPDLWIADAAPLMGVQALTLAAAASRAKGQLRLMFLAVLAAGIAGVAAGWIVGLWWPSVLCLQLQVWRAWWLVAALSALAFAYLVLALGLGSPRDRIALAFLTLAWAEYELGAVAPAVAAIAVVLSRRETMPAFAFTPRQALWAWAAVAAAIAGLWVVELHEMKPYLFGWPADYRPRLVRFVFAVLQQPLIVGCTIAAIVADRLKALRSIPRMGIAIALAFAALFFWNDASSFDRALARGEIQDSLAKAAHSGDGDILWLAASNEPWLWLRQPSWAARIQGAGIIFSRQLSQRYEERARILLDLDIDDLSTSRVSRRLPFRPPPSGEAFDKLCARADAPTTIIAPVDAAATVPGDWNARTIWRAPATRMELPDGDISRSIAIRDYAVILCEDHRPQAH